MVLKMQDVYMPYVGQLQGINIMGPQLSGASGGFAKQPPLYPVKSQLL